MNLNKNTNLENSENSSDVLTIEAAIDKAGYGLYSYLMTCLTGICIISFGCVAYGNTFIVPTSACEFGTTTAQQGILAAGPVVGMILGGLVWGYLADTRGRRSMLLVALLGGAIFNTIATISVDWIMLLIFQFIASIFASGLYTMSMTLLSESVPVAHRNFVVLLVSSIFLLSQGIMALLALPIIPLSFSYYIAALDIYWNSWRLLMLVFSIPNLITAACVYFVYESPKFIFIKGDPDRALDILRSIHRINNRSSKEEFQVKGLLEETQAVIAKPSPKDQIVPLFKAPLLKYTIIVTALQVSKQTGAFLIWLPTIADQFVSILQEGGNTNRTMCGILDMDPIPADPNATPCALNETSLYMVLGICALQSLFNICISLSVNAVGRRNMTLIITSVCGVSGILVNLVPNIIGSTVLFVVFLQSIVVVGLYTAMVVAFIPTHLKAMAIALTATGARIAAFASIQILNALLVNHCDAGFYLFSCLLASSAIWALFLPDDRKLQTKPTAAEEETTKM